MLDKAGSTIATSAPASRWRTIFEVSSTIVMVALAGALVWQGRARFFDAGSAPAGVPAPTSVRVPREPIAIAGSPTLGSASAKIAIVEYSDFECAFCGKAAREIVPQLKRDYVDTGKARIVFKNFPLGFHRLAPGAAAAALCAEQQGKFWQMHDRLFTEPIELADQDLRAAAGHVGLDLAAYESCRSGTAAAKRVDADKAEAEALKITGTPVFFVGRIEPDGRFRATDSLFGAKPIGEFKAALDRLLE